jgi:hypothetical protein
MQNTVRRPKIVVSGDGSGIVSHAGALLLTETVRITGLQTGLSAGLSRWRPGRAFHDPAKIVTDLAVAVALGGDCLADAGVLAARRDSRAASHDQPLKQRASRQLRPATQDQERSRLTHRGRRSGLAA